MFILVKITTSKPSRAAKRFKVCPKTLPPSLTLLSSLNVKNYKYKSTVFHFSYILSRLVRPMVYERSQLKCVPTPTVDLGLNHCVLNTCLNNWDMAPRNSMMTMSYYRGRAGELRPPRQARRNRSLTRRLGLISALGVGRGYRFN